MGSPSQSVKIPPRTNRQELGVCPFPGSTHSVSLSLLPSSILSLCRAGAALAPAHAMALKKVVCLSWLAQEVRATTTEPSCRRFSPCFGAAWLPQETYVPNSLSLTCCCQPTCGSTAREQGDSLLPAPHWLWKAPPLLQVSRAVQQDEDRESQGGSTLDSLEPSAELPASGHGL